MARIYILHAEGTSKFKIGITKGKVSNRIKSLQTANPYTLVEYFSLESKYASQVERATHRFHSTNRLNGEWFEFTPQELKKAIESIKKTHENIEYLDKNQI